jgi:glycerophosphoryl diester phosphodiesterase
MKTVFSLICIIAIMSCSDPKKLATTGEQSGQGSFDIQGHRGCRGLMPENTIPAMITAIDLGVTTLELDVVVTKDKKVIVSHEPWFGKHITTKPDGSFMGEREERKFNIYWMTYEETKAFDVGMKPHPLFPRQQKMKVNKPLLSELIDSVNDAMMIRRRPFPFFNIEIKSDSLGDGVFHPKTAEFAELVMSVIKEKKLESQVNIQSFDFRPLRYLHENYPALKLAVLLEGTDKRSVEEQLKSLGFIPAVYSPHYSVVTPDLVKACHSRGMKLIPWTVNEKEKIDVLRKMGVDGIITDYPDLFSASQ